MEKDLRTKTITGCLDVFSDICNVNLFEQEEVIHADELVPVKTDSVYKDGKGKQREHRRDVCMRHTSSGLDIAIISLENQSDVCNIMPVRDLGYLYSGYQNQIDMKKQENERKGKRFFARVLGKDQKLLPIVSLVLYYGTEDWDGPISIMDMLELSEEWKKRLAPLIADHQIRLIHLARQDKKTRKAYQSDFRHVVDYLHYLRKKAWKKLNKFATDKTRTVTHPVEFLDVMGAFTGDGRYQEMAKRLEEEHKEEEVINMCVLLDYREERGEKHGKDQISQLILMLTEDGRNEDILRMAQDSEYQDRLLEEYGIC